jgi:hypothetical protein
MFCFEQCWNACVALMRAAAAASASSPALVESAQAPY